MLPLKERILVWVGIVIVFFWGFIFLNKEGNMQISLLWSTEKNLDISKKLEKQEDFPASGEQYFLPDRLKTDTSKHSIELDSILGGGPWKDGIPSINTPEFVSQEIAEKQMPYLLEDSRWIVLDIWGYQRYYSYDVLVWHEIVNDVIWWQKVSVTFCSLCGSAIVYDREVNGKEVNFWVSGKLYNSNLLMYDSYDETLWSQSLWKAVVWWQLGTKLTVMKSHLMTYDEFIENFPEGVVLSDDTGYFRNYGRIPYGDYNNSDDLYFPIDGAIDTSFHPKELFYIVNHHEHSLAFNWKDLRKQGTAEIRVWEDVYIASFNRGLADVTLDGEILPGYFEMWFSWINHNAENKKNIWSK